MSEIMDNSSPLNNTSNSEAKPKVDSSENKDDMKNISPYMSKDLIAAAGFNVETPIVNAIIGNLTGSLSTKKNDTETIKCDVCDCELSSTVVLSFHLNGSKHKKRVGKLKALEIIEQLKGAKDKGVQLGNSDNPNAFRCEVCCVTVNSAQQLEVHLSGSKHKKKLAKSGATESEANGLSKNCETSEIADQDSSPSPVKKQKKDEPKLLSCDICNVFMNSPTQFDQHLLSKKHMNKVNGEQQKRKSLGRGRFMKFPPFRSRGGHFSSENTNFTHQNNQYNPLVYKRMFPYSNFLTKQPFYNNFNNGVNNSFI